VDDTQLRAADHTAAHHHTLHAVLFRARGKCAWSLLNYHSLTSLQLLQWAEDYQVHVFFIAPIITALVAEFIVQSKYLQVTAGRGHGILNEEVPFLS
jgi:hypothetical protein